MCLVVAVEQVRSRYSVLCTLYSVVVVKVCNNLELVVEVEEGGTTKTIGCGRLECF